MWFSLWVVLDIYTRVLFEQVINDMIPNNNLHVNHHPSLWDMWYSTRFYILLLAGAINLYSYLHASVKAELSRLIKYILILPDHVWWCPIIAHTKYMCKSNKYTFIIVPLSFYIKVSFHYIYIVRHLNMGPFSSSKHLANSVLFFAFSWCTLVQRQHSCAHNPEWFVKVCFVHHEPYFVHHCEREANI